ncbi:MAG: hypothetical protein LBB88_00975 [Planctomycetaceae bacterium]|jgi:hypothetical protein|nr:hypothetical protein [Planctomycetaceae bacterium]
MFNNYVKKSGFAYFAAIVFVITYGNSRFFCYSTIAQEVLQITQSKEKAEKTEQSESPKLAPPEPSSQPSLPSQHPQNLQPIKSTPSQIATTPTNPITPPTPTTPTDLKTQPTQQNNSTQQNPQTQPNTTNTSASEENSKTTTPATKPIVLTVPMLTATEHSWGRFAPSSWRRVQTTTWTISDGRRIGNINETKTILDSVDENSVTLQEIITAGANAETEGVKPVKKSFDFYNVALGEGMKITNGTPMKLIVDGRFVPCERRIYEQTTPTVTRKITVWYSTQIYPYVMRIERTVKSVPTATETESKILSQSTFEVTDSSAFRLLTSKQGSYRTRTVKRSGDVTTVTDSYCSLHVPGGLIKEYTHEFDGQGKEIRQIETRLLNYYYVSVPAAIVAPNTAVPNQPLIIQYDPVRPRWRQRSYRLRSTPYQYYYSD